MAASYSSSCRIRCSSKSPTSRETLVFSRAASMRAHRATLSSTVMVTFLNFRTTQF